MRARPGETVEALRDGAWTPAQYQGQVPPWGNTAAQGMQIVRFPDGLTAAMPPGQVRDPACACTCDAWGHPGACDGRGVCTLTASPRDPALDLWPAANTGEFRICPPCVQALRRLADRVEPWARSIEMCGYPTAGMLEEAEIRRLTERHGL